MNTADYVAQEMERLKKDGTPLPLVAWRVALLCVGWAYVFGARGETCTPAHRRTRYNGTAEGKDKDNIKNKCKNFEGAGSCSGCKWYPGGARTLFFDCRGFTYWVLLQVFGWRLMGVGATSQWNTESNWKAKGDIATMPKDTLVCLFVRNGSKMEHTGFGYNNETIECSNGVLYFTTRNKKWTHWGVPVCIDGEITPSPTPPTKPTLRRGARGEYVTLSQTMLIQKGYDCGASGADGIFGTGTENAVRSFQHDHGLSADGIIGQKTWAALDSTEPAAKYTITIPHLSKSQADALCSQYPGSIMTAERG